MRVWGMNQPPSLFFQLEYITKYPRDSEIESELYSMNRLLLQHDGHEVSRIYSRNEIIPFSNNEKVLLDCQAVNLLHHYSNLQNLSHFSILDYSSLGHRYVSVSDILPLNHFVRALVRCLKFKRKYNITSLWNWRMPWESEGWAISNLLWHNKFLDHELLTSKCRSFMDKHISLFPELSGLSASSKVLLICPHTNHDFSKFLWELQQLLESDSEALNSYKSAERIYVKQHRITPHYFPATFELLGRTIKVIEHPLTRNLPSEILLLGIQNLVLFSTISSLVFAAQKNEVKAFGKMSNKDYKDYGFMLARAKKRWKSLDYPRS